MGWWDRVRDGVDAVAVQVERIRGGRPPADGVVQRSVEESQPSMAAGAPASAGLTEDAPAGASGHDDLPRRAARRTSLPRGVYGVVMVGRRGTMSGHGHE